MRRYDYKGKYEKLLLPDIVAMISQIHEYKGEQSLFIEAKSDTLAQLLEIAKIQSTEASNRIEGIYVSDERLRKIVKDKTMPKTRNEKEIAGYRDVLNTIHENYDYIPIKSTTFLQLHRDFYKFSSNEGGRFKSAENIEELCKAFNDMKNYPEYDPLLLIPMFVLDFLCIHPFDDGNGRLSRLLTLLLLYRAGYMIGMYISIEKLIEQTKMNYYEALQESSLGWDEGENNYLPFVRYMLGVVVAAYRDFSSRAQLLAVNRMSKPDRIREIVRETIGKVTRAEIMEKCPDISQVTVERTLTEMVKNREILKIGGGRYTAYVWNREK